MTTDAMQTVAAVDTLQHIETPEGVVLALRPAGLLPRALAWLIDLMLKLAIILVAMFVYSTLGNFGVGLGLIVLFASTWGYSVLFEVLNNGTTPGKASLNLQVVRTNGAPVTWSASIIRNFIRLVDMLPFIYGVGTVVMLTNERFQRLGDIAADTLVVYRTADPEPIAPLSPRRVAPLRLRRRHRRRPRPHAHPRRPLSSGLKVAG